MKRDPINWKKYVYSFAITATIFATAIYMSNFFGQKKLNEIRSIQDKIAIDILSSETQFSLLEEASCADVGGTSALSQELENLEDKLAFTEKDRGSNDEKVLTLKRYYSLLEIKDYLLLQKISQKCKTTPLTIIYFYSNKGDCRDCEKEGFVLTHLRQTYPDLRVYSFDYDIDLSAVKTLIGVKKVKNQLPAIIIDDKTLYGFQSLDTLEAIPKLKAMKDALTASSSAKKLQEAATSTKR